VTGHRVLFCSRFFYVDSSNGAAIANRALMECLARRGFAVEALCGTTIDAGLERDPAAELDEQGIRYRADDPAGEGAASAGMPASLVANVAGVPLTILHIPLRRYGPPDAAESEGLLALFDRVCERSRPDVLVTYGGDGLSLEILRRARVRGMATVFTLHNFAYPRPDTFRDVDAVLVPSEFSARYHREALGLDCTALPCLVDSGRMRAEAAEPRYVTFVNPSPEKGVFAFARIADELGRRRPDIPLLVVESRGSEATLVRCGIDLRGYGNVFLMAQTPDPRDFWGVTRLCLVPSLWWESQGLVAVEAMINGIPVLASDRGALPETLGDAGLALSLPDRLTTATRSLPTAEEVRPWVEAIIRLWDDPVAYADHLRRALAQAERWRPERVEPRYERFFAEVRPKASPATDNGRAARADWVVLVPFLHAIEWDCDLALRELESSGVRVVRARGASAIDVARNTLLSEALRRGSESILFIDADIGFDPRDALRLLARPEPAVAGVYLKKGSPEFACKFAPEVREALFGPGAPGLYPLDYAPAGFLRVRPQVLRKMIDELALPLCNTELRGGFWPFFQPMVVPGEAGDARYLGEDWSFCHRLRQIGITPMADTSIRLFHIGAYGYSWEDAAAPPVRYPHLTFNFSPPGPEPPP
jgi:glycosyltransferase involved in cell wall biosynthesis